MNENYYEVLGKHIQDFVLRKWTTQNKAAKILGVHPSRLSKMINGARPPGANLVLRLIRWGMDEVYFERWKSIEGLNADNYGKNEWRDLAMAQKHLIDNQSKVISILNKRISDLI